MCLLRISVSYRFIYFPDTKRIYCAGLNTNGTSHREGSDLPHRLRKNRKQRGSRTCGWGQVSQHRGSGSRGGHGKAGTHKGRWNQNEPKWQPRVGFRCPSEKSISTINLRDLARLVPPPRSKGKSDAAIKTVDLTSLGYDKLLGAGRIDRPLRVKVGSASESVIRKISEAGGEVVIS